jgi:hypothetical protein
VVEDTAHERVLAQHRVRHTGGVSTELAAALRDELAATAALVTTVTQYDDDVPPVLAATARLVATAPAPHVLWTGEVVRVGDEHPGFLSLATVVDDAELTLEAVNALASAVAGAEDQLAAAARGRFAPRRVYRAPAARAVAVPRVAVLPLRNESTRRHAGDIVALALVRHLAAGRYGIEVLEPGVVREALLRARMVAAEGLSAPQIELLRVVLDADLVVSGTVHEYVDGGAVLETPRLDFAIQVFDTHAGRAVWSGLSHNAGDDRVFFFDLGRVRTASTLASRMARALVADAFAAHVQRARRRSA